MVSRATDIPTEPDDSQPPRAAKPLRLFFAAWPPARVAEALHRWALEAARGPAERVLPVENLHLTLAFLGDTHPARVPAAIDAARAVAIAPQTLRLDRTGHWPRSRVVWAGSSETLPALEALVADLRARLTAAGFVLEDREFAAHVTLARQAPRPYDRPLPALDWPIAGFVLACSTTAERGSRYDVVERFGAPATTVNSR